jgi:ubiquitin-small subunit ribosomal protein S27Ae
MAKKKKADKKPMQIWKLYEVKDGKVIRKNPFSQKAGPGSFMANHKDRLTCGKTGYMEKKDKKDQ